MVRGPVRMASTGSTRTARHTGQIVAANVRTNPSEAPRRNTAGWKRSFVLRSWGYCKDSTPTTMTAGAVGPLPYRGMPRYPYDTAKNPPPAALLDYDQKWNTRPVGGR